jgi:hypothetical protein
MSNSSTLIVVQHIDVNVQPDTSGMSPDTIGTSALGPCICIMSEFLFDEQPKCIVDHYSFGSDEKNGQRK